MCLEIKKIRHLNNKAKIAKRSIKCYKVLIYSHDELKTPTIYECISSSTEGLIADNMRKNTCGTKIIHGIHTFSTLRAAYQFCDLISIHIYTVGIFPAIIPKGTYYWIGRNHQYASERIEFL